MIRTSSHPPQAKILPLRLHVDQDALDFLKQFFAFKDPDAAPPANPEPVDEIYFRGCYPHSCKYYI